jgi:hypothetical protein
MTFGPGGGPGQTHAYTCANSQVLFDHVGGNVYPNLTKDLPALKWRALAGLRGSWGWGEQVSLNQAVWFFKVPNFP